MTEIIKRTVSHLTMTNANNVVLSSWLAARQPLAPKVVINILASTVIGATTGGAAFVIDDVSSFTSVIINNYGEIQGQGGVANGGWGGNAVHSTGGIVTLNNYGAIRSGGGGGAKAGDGASGNWVNAWSTQYWDSSKYVWYDHGVSSNQCKWNSTAIGYANDYPYIYRSSYVYTRGSVAPDPFGGFNYIKRATRHTGVAGTGGNGGRGQGYNQTRYNGSAGTTGSYYAGKGGTGGNGGAWGANGNTGGTGGTGSAFKDYGSASFDGRWYGRITTYATVPGASFAPAGYSLIATDGGNITLTNTGTINGPKSGVS